MVCSKCGNSINEHSVYCPYCGFENASNDFMFNVSDLKIPSDDFRSIIDLKPIKSDSKDIMSIGLFRYGLLLIIMISSCAFLVYSINNDPIYTNKRIPAQVPESYYETNTSNDSNNSGNNYSNSSNYGNFDKYSNNKIIQIKETIKIRKGPSTKEEKVGVVKNGEEYNVLDMAHNEGYTWYNIGTNQWIADDGTWTCGRYTIQYYSNNGFNEFSESTYYLKWNDRYSANYTIDCMFAMDGYKLTSWNTQPDGSGRTFLNGQSIVDLLQENQSFYQLYAQWEYDNNSINAYLNAIQNNTTQNDSSLNNNSYIAEDEHNEYNIIYEIANTYYSDMGYYYFLDDYQLEQELNKIGYHENLAEAINYIKNMNYKLDNYVHNNLNNYGYSDMEQAFDAENSSVLDINEPVLRSTFDNGDTNDLDFVPNLYNGAAFYSSYLWNLVAYNKNNERLEDTYDNTILSIFQDENGSLHLVPSTILNAPDATITFFVKGGGGIVFSANNNEIEFSDGEFIIPNDILKTRLTDAFGYYSYHSYDVEYSEQFEENIFHNTGIFRDFNVSLEF